VESFQVIADEPHLGAMGRRPAGVTPGVGGVSETMLWALFNRAAEAQRDDAVLTDPDSVSIYRAIDYDFARNFGAPAGSLAARGAEIDRVLRRWLGDHPDGLVVSLGEGLETQVRRVDNGTMRWLSVDLPDVIQLREQFLSPNERFRHIAANALDPAWMDAVDASSGVFIVAQGLLMYLPPEDVGALLATIADRFPGAEMVFDVVPRWFSQLTMIGLQRTWHYRLPRMPWGINRDEVTPTLRRWHPRLGNVTFLDYRLPRGPLRLWETLAHGLPLIRNERPSLVHVTTGTAEHRSMMKEKPMTYDFAHEPAVATMSEMLSLATRTADSSNGLALAAGQVIAKRVALGMAAAVNPLAADHAEFARMVPEKVEAFSAVGMAVIEQSQGVVRQMVRRASDEMLTTARASMDIATSPNPMAMMDAQGRFAQAWFGSVAASFMALGTMVLGAQAAALRPLHEAVAANKERLS
jgi:O-methyltransferase involved in polyketide biosynthesis